VKTPPEAAICKELRLAMLCHAGRHHFQRGAGLMASDYVSIRATMSAVTVRTLAASARCSSDRYDRRHPFYFRLLQNAEDALARRTGWSGQRLSAFISRTMNCVSAFRQGPSTRPMFAASAGSRETKVDRDWGARASASSQSTRSLTGPPNPLGPEGFAMRTSSGPSPMGRWSGSPTATKSHCHPR